MSANAGMIRVAIPFHLQTLAQAGPEVMLEAGTTPTLRSLLLALETKYPALRGAVYEHDKGKRRPLIRFFACRQDWSFTPLDTTLPPPVIEGSEPFMIVGAIAGG